MKKIMRVRVAAFLSAIGVAGALAEIASGEVTCEHDWSNKDGVCARRGTVCMQPERTYTDADGDT